VIFVSNNKIMNLPNPKLTKRMKCFIDHAIKDEALWDICCDHGYVGIKALETSQFSEVHFVDQVPHIMNRLDTLIKQYWRIKPEHKYTLHLISGEDLEFDVEGTMLVAGVGGLTIKTIVSRLLEKNKLHAKRLLLSPHTDEKVLINYLDDVEFQHLYSVTDKILMPEGKRFRPLYVLDRK
jgi:tRNA (adenine22-N1)-methyltransferase